MKNLLPKNPKHKDQGFIYKQPVWFNAHRDMFGQIGWVFTSPDKWYPQYQHEPAGYADPSADRDKYPHECPVCGKPAFMGIMPSSKPDCSAQCAGSKTWPMNA